LRRILGIDPGLASTGWGVIDVEGSRLLHIEHGTIETEAHTPHPRRLLAIYDGIRVVMRDFKPTEGAIETLYFARNVSSAMSVAEARGVLELAAAQVGIAMLETKPNDIKKAVVGEGRADKRQVQDMVRLILGLAEIPKPDHAADALGAAICAAHSYAT
jgi:crossover junction endodeoxyribonuclease RuvC